MAEKQILRYAQDDNPFDTHFRLRTLEGACDRAAEGIFAGYYQDWSVLSAYGVRVTSHSSEVDNLSDGLISVERTLQTV